MRHLSSKILPQANSNVLRGQHEEYSISDQIGSPTHQNIQIDQVLRGFDITQADFASRIGVSQSYLSAVERGRNEVGAEVLLAISWEFDKSLEWLLTGEE